MIKEALTNNKKASCIYFLIYSNIMREWQALGLKKPCLFKHIF
jgi:hypothetical protein